MQLIAVPTASLGERLAVVRSAVTAVLLLATGLILAWAFLGTPNLTALVPAGRPSAGQVLVGVLGLTFAILAPASLLVLGAVRTISTIEAAAALRPRGVLPRIARTLGPDHLAAADVRLPDGRRIRGLILGAFGVVVVGDVPPAATSRSAGARWEIRDDRGGWSSIEPPLERAARDGEAVRRWLASHDHDFVVKVYSVLVTDDRRLERSAACAVVAPSELNDWLLHLPPQRGLTPTRRADLTEVIRAATLGR